MIDPNKFKFIRVTYESETNPTPQNDGEDTANIDRAFLKGDFWLNTITNTHWVCINNSENSAIWKRIIFSEYGELGLLTFSKGGVSQDMYLYTDESIPSNICGYRMIRNGTIVGISWQGSKGANESGHVRIRKNSLMTNIASISIAYDQKGNHDGNLNVNFDAGDRIQAYIENGKVNDITVIIEIKWR